MLETVGTHSVWIPATGKRVVITGISISSYPGGTLAFYFDNGNDKFAEFSLAASGVITPTIGPIESTVTSGRIFAVNAVSGGGACRVNLQGFEIE